ncbi:MAG: hypothetical protein AAF975_03660 [Spirochaetota bacterium]
MAELQYSAFSENSPLASLELEANEFEALLAVNGQDCLWLKNQAMSGQDTHNVSGGRSASGVYGDGRATTYPSRTDWRSVALTRLSKNLYKSKIPLESCRPPETLLQPDLIRSEQDAPTISIEARMLLSYKIGETVTAKIDGELDLPQYNAGKLSSVILKDSADKELEIIGYTKNKLYAAKIKAKGTYRFSFSSSPPIKLSLLSQNLHRVQPWVLGLRGDASLTFPDWLPITYQDEIISLGATVTVEHKITCTGGATLELPEPFVAKIIDIDGHSEEPILLENNKLYWPKNPPTKGHSVVVTYRVHPAYKVLEQLPSTRSQENQKHPRRAALQLITRY